MYVYTYQSKTKAIQPFGMSIHILFWIDLHVGPGCPSSVHAWQKHNLSYTTGLNL